jgi:hypothetical protein
MKKALRRFGGGFAFSSLRELPTPNQRLAKKANDDDKDFA